MSIFDSMQNLLAEVKVATRKQMDKEVQTICDDGFVEFSNEMLALSERGLDLEAAKVSGDKYGKMKGMLESLRALMRDMQELREDERINSQAYESLTGHTLRSVLAVKAGEAKSTVKAKDPQTGGFISGRIHSLQEKRNALFEAINLHVKQRKFFATAGVSHPRYKNILAEMLDVIDAEKTEMSALCEEISEATALAQDIEFTYSYQVVDGKRIYPEHPHNLKHKELKKQAGRLIAELTPMAGRFGAPDISAELSRSKRVFGIR